MDVASSPPAQGSIHETPPPPPPPVESANPPPSASHHRRHTRYSSTTASHPPPPPHVVIDTRRRGSPHHPRSRNTMNSSATTSSVSATSAGRIPPRPVSHAPPSAGGQDHDRMETDEESERSGSETESREEEDETRPQESTSTDRGPTTDTVPMDMTPDFPEGAEGAAPPTTNSQGSQTHIATVHVGTNTNGGPDRLAGWEFSTIDAWPSGLPGQAQIQVAAGDAMLDSGILRQELDDARRRDEPRERDQDRERDRDRERERERDRDRERERDRPREDRDEDGDDGSDSDESMDEADNPYWANFTPDTSSPDESELAAIEESEEVNGTDHEHWESLTFEPLEDPEYVPKETGRICWTVTGNHGTPDKPNRKHVMRSPSVYIGGFYWNIKYFPRGNDGTECMSVYVECSPKPYESLEEDLSEIEVLSEGKFVAEGAPPETTSPSTNGTVPDPQASTAETESCLPVDTPQTPESEPEAPWFAPAQVACVVYNPEEPRVYAHQQCTHQYYNGNPDWGWTRFHGPWREIHNRRRNQRKPLLQNDTLVFTAYIRIVEDHTKSLWWHPSDSQPIWDSVSLLGLRGLKCRDSQSSALVAAISAWMHLACTVSKILAFDIPDRVTQPGAFLQPALKELQELLIKEGQSSASSEINLSALASVLGFFYGSEIDFKKDVVIVWENLRRVLNLESSPEHENDPAHDFLEEVAMLKQPDPCRNTDLLDAYLVELRGTPWIDVDHEPASVQESLDYASMYGGKAFKSWEKAKGQNKHRAPNVLQIELHRQNYESDTRKWKKLTHKIALDEVVICNKHEYTLYGMIVHRGGLDYNEYYSVLRPEGPGSRWIKYSGEGSSRAVEVLTSKAAVEAHEGGNDDESAAVAYIAIYVRSDRLVQILSHETRTEVLQGAQKRKSEQISTSEGETKLTDVNPLRIGRRHWRKAPPISDGRFYDDIRELAHLSRAFYRTEYDTTEKATNPLPVEPKPEQADKSDESDPASHKIHGWLKVFHHNQQRLSEARKFSADGSMNVIHHLKELLGVPNDESWDFYFEQGLTIKPKNLVKRSSTFFDISYGDVTWDGMLFIGQRHLSAEEISDLEMAGKCVSPVEYSQYLLGDYHPALYSNHLSNHYFTYPYLSVPLSYSQPHGQGIHIALSGSEYHGPFRRGRKAGPNGTMRYANGDTYVGDWAADEPDGQGTMTYAKTGNVYTGGWRKRRRHGKGEMKYEFADEEMMLCGVCYERDMDAVFCFCGHVVACEECARRVEYCPVCREVVKRVVVLKGPLGSGDGKSGGGVGSWAGGSEGGGGVGIIP